MTDRTIQSGPRPGQADVRPRYGDASLSDVLPAVIAAIRGGRADAPTSPGDDDDRLALATPLAGVRAVAVLLVDGLGQELIERAASPATYLRQLIARPAAAHHQTITAGFPSTTPTSLTSLGTGTPPGTHGILGFRLNIPGTQRILNHIDWADQPDPVRWQPVPTQFDRAVAAGIDSYVVTRPEFIGSGLSRAAYRGGDVIAADRVEATISAILTTLAAATTPTLVYGYHADLDVAAHVHGIDSPQWRKEMARVDQMIAALVEGLPADTALVVTADHGLVDVPANRRFDIGRDTSLCRGVRLIAGEPRVRYLHTEPGSTHDVIDTWRGVLGPAAWVVDRDDAVAQGWFGHVPEEHLRRVGDVVVACHSDFAVLSSATEPATVSNLIAFHGSATTAEMLVPLLVARR